MKVLVDTSAFYAITDKADTNHSQAYSFYHDSLKRRSCDFVTTNFILVETWLLINSRNRLGYDKAMEFWKALAVPLLGITQANLEEALRIQSKYEDQEYSLIDCTTIAIMTRLSISAIFCFDQHFQSFRDQKGRAFNCFPCFYP